MAKKIYRLTVIDFAKLFGTTVSDLPAHCKKIIKTSDFRYYKLPHQEKLQLMKEISQKIENNVFDKAGKESKKVWQKKWSDRLHDFTAQDHKMEVLTPKYYYGPERLHRLNNNFIEPLDKNFELNFECVYKYWLFGKYFKEIGCIYEFGGGTGMNMSILAGLFPKKKLYCSDWVDSSKKIVDRLAKKYGWQLSGFVFDMFKPNFNIKIKNKSAFLTFSSLEQLGYNYEAFIKFTLKKKATIFLAVDSFEELYDKHNPFDYLAVKFIKKRNYLSNYLNYLHQLEKMGQIEIIKVQRVPFGNLYHEGYSYVAWKPRLSADTY